MSHGRVAFTIAAAVCLMAPSASWGVSPVKRSGAISGLVTDNGGIPQMGAAVFLFNRQEKLHEKVLTDERGYFAFAGLLPDVYSIRITLASFVPAIKNNIMVQPGMRSMLNVSLATLFSSIQLVYPGPGQRVLMDDDWKWVLRTASEMRPVLRLLPNVNQSPAKAQTTSAFSDTRGLVRLSAGDADDASGYGAQADLGTAFALATSLFGENQVQVAGKVGYGAQFGMPSAAFRTSFSRNVGYGSPEVSLTMRQLYLPGQLAGTSGGNMPALRTMTVDFDDQTQLSDNLWLRYGFSLDSVSFLDRLNYLSPYARLSYDGGDAGTLELTYTSGNARPDLAGWGRPGTELQHDLRTLALFPRVSLQRGRARVERGENYEISYSRTFGSRKLQVAGYRESVSNTALMMDAPEGLYAFSSDLLPDLYSGSSVFNAGNYESLGYTASVTQSFGDNVSTTLIYGSMGALTADSGEVASESPDELRSMIRAGRRHAATLRTKATLPWSGTQVVASYQWADAKSVSPGHLYSTQSVRPEPGFNVYFRQPVPWSLLPWRMEISADLRNLLAQGYMPLNVAGGRRVFLMQTPRAFRGGLSFIF
ncbi:MAG TPA: TonB-dependent receptor [Bryobacteraceae bacterium]|nr:TonB-dependent receptor [Bryobacteraceae bacterium]